MTPRRTRQISLIRGAQSYVFRYLEGDEPQVIGSFVNLAEDAASGFDWIDAAVLTLEVGRRQERLHRRTDRRDVQGVGRQEGCTESLRRW
jgi:hypothetical protein